MDQFDGWDYEFVDSRDEVLENVARWNQGMGIPGATTHWQHGSTTYFVYDGQGSFAPSKFCAYVCVGVGEQRHPMTVERYIGDDGANHRTNGRDARRHLQNHIGMRLTDGNAAPEVLKAFRAWLDGLPINVDPDGPRFLTHG